MSLCIEVDSSISIASVAPQFVISSLNALTSEIRPVYDTNLKSWIDAEGKVCANISKSGTYFASAIVSNFATQTNSVSQAQYYVGAVLYLLCLVFGTVQLVMIILDWHNERILTHKIVFISIILLNNLIRTIYVLLPVNAFKGGLDSIQFIVFELPTFIYFSVFTAIIYMWFLVVLKAKLWSKRGEAAHRERQMRLAFSVGNCLMYFVFVIFIFLIAILPEKQKPPHASSVAQQRRAQEWYTTSSSRTGSSNSSSSSSSHSASPSVLSLSRELSSSLASPSTERDPSTACKWASSQSLESHA